MLGEEAIMSSTGAAFQSLIAQVARLATGLAGIATVASGVSSIMTAVGKAFSAAIKVVSVPLQLLGAAITGMGSLITGAFKSLAGAFTDITHAFTSLTDAAVKLTTGLVELGAAAYPGGLQAFGEVLEYATAVLGKVAVPVFVAFSTAVLTVTRYFADQLMSAAEGFATFIGQNLVEAITQAIIFFQVTLPDALQTAVEWLYKAVDAVKAFIDSLPGHGGGFSDKSMQAGGAGAAAGLLGGAAIGAGIGSVVPVIGTAAGALAGAVIGALGLGALFAGANQKLEDRQNPRQAAADDGKAMFEGIGGLAPQRQLDIKDAVQKAMDDIKNAAANAFGKQGNVGFSGITDAQKQIQMQAFRSKIASDTLKEQIKSRELLQRIADNVAGPENGPVVAP